MQNMNTGPADAGVRSLPVNAPGRTREKLHDYGLQEFNTTDCMACKDTCQGGRKMAPVLTAEDVVRRIAVECAFVEERGGVDIWQEPAARDREAVR